MPINGVPSNSNIYQQQPLIVPEPTHRPQPPRDLTAAKPIITRPVPAISKRAQINKYPRENEQESKTLGQYIDLNW